MENAIGCIVGNAYTSMLSSTGRHLSSAIWGKVSCFVAGAVAGAGVTYCVIKGKEIREKLLTLMVVDPKISKTFILDNLSHKSWKHAGNIYKINKIYLKINKFKQLLFINVEYRKLFNTYYY